MGFYHSWPLATALPHGSQQNSGSVRYRIQWGQNGNIEDQFQNKHLQKSVIFENIYMQGIQSWQHLFQVVHFSLQQRPALHPSLCSPTQSKYLSGEMHYVNFLSYLQHNSTTVFFITILTQHFTQSCCFSTIGELF